MQEDTPAGPAPPGTENSGVQEGAEAAVLLSEGNAGLCREVTTKHTLHEQGHQEQETEERCAAFSGRLTPAPALTPAGTPPEAIKGLHDPPASQLDASTQKAGLCVRELDSASLQQLPILGLSFFYRDKCKKDGIQENPLVLECLALYDERTVYRDGRDEGSSTRKITEPLNISCCGSDKRVFCQRLDDRQLIPVVHTLAFAGANLRSLDLSYNVLSNDAAVSLGTLLRCCCQHIAVVNLQSNCISATGCASLCESFAVCKSIEAVNLSFNPLGREGALAVATWLETNPSATTVRLNSCQLDADGLIALSVALTDKNTTVRELDVGNLTKFSLEPNYCYYLSGMLERNNTLRELCLAKQSIGDDGIKILVPVLKSNKSLVKLDLSCNRITFYGGKALQVLLSENTTLQHLNMNCNRLAKYGAKSIAEGLRVNTSLVVLRINNNGIPPPALICLAEAIKMNTSLAHVDVAMNDFDSESAEAFKRLMGPESPRPARLTTDFFTYTVDGATFIANI